MSLLGPGYQTVTNSSSTSFSNKSLQDASTLVIDDLNNTKQLKFLMDNSSANTVLTLAPQQTTSQTLNIPNIVASDTMVTSGLAQKLTGCKIWGGSTYSTGTISKSGTTITGSGTTFTIGMLFGVIIWADGTIDIVTVFTSATQLSVSASATKASSTYTLYYQANIIGWPISGGYSGSNLFTAKIFSNSSIVDFSDPSKQITFNLSSNTSGAILALSTSQSSNATLYVPNVSTGDTLATLNLANTFTAANTITDSTNATSTSTGAVKISGGVGIVKDVWCAYIYNTVHWARISQFSAQTKDGKDGTTTITTGTKFQVEFDNTDYNSGSLYTIANTVGNYYIQVPIAGVYSLTASWFWATTGSGTSQGVYINKCTGTPNYTTDTCLYTIKNTQTSANGVVNCSFTTVLAANDRIYCAAILVGSGSLQLAGSGSTFQNSFLIIRFEGR